MSSASFLTHRILLVLGSSLVYSSFNRLSARLILERGFERARWPTKEVSKWQWYETIHTVFGRLFKLSWQAFCRRSLNPGERAFYSPLGVVNSSEFFGQSNKGRRKVFTRNQLNSNLRGSTWLTLPFSGCRLSKIESEWILTIKFRAKHSEITGIGLGSP